MFIFILYQPTPGPGIIQRLGWQSWDTIDIQEGPSTPTNTSGGVTTGSPQPPPGNTGVDWWNATAEEITTADQASLPLDVWAPLMPHDTGRASTNYLCICVIIIFLVSEIVITRCFVNPRLGSGICDPKSTSEQDAIRGKWVRVDRSIHQLLLWLLFAHSDDTEISTTRAATFPVTWY
jgi:hypothetical protein